MSIDVYSEYKPLPWQVKFHQGNWTHGASVGGKGSGKTRSCIEELKMCALEFPETAWLIGRKTLPSLKDTTYREFLECTPEALIRDHNKSDRNIILVNGSIIMFRPLDEPKKFDSLKISGFLIDEADENERPVYDTLKSRMRQLTKYGQPRFRSMLSLNPCEEDHWIPELFLHTKPKDHEIFFSSAIDNQENLPLGYVDQLRSIYTNDMQMRMIYGQFGRVHRGSPVYPQFTRGNFITAVDPMPKHPIYQGWDFGYRRPSCVWSQFIDGQFRVLAERLGKNIYLEDFIRTEVLPYQQSLFGDWPQYRAFCDPHGSDESDKGKTSVEILNDHNIFPVHRRTRIQEGIKAVKELMDTKSTSGLSNFIIHPRCQNLIEGFRGGYHREDGEDDPFKDNHYDHCFVAGTKIQTPFGLKNIETVKPGDLVSTRKGPRKVYAANSAGVRETALLEFSNGAKLQCTPDHKIFSIRRGFIRADSLSYDDVLVSYDEWQKLLWKPSSWMELFLDDIQNIKIKTSRLISGLLGGRGGPFSCTDTYGNKQTVLSQINTMFTTKTVMPEITGYQTLNAYLLPNTTRNTLPRVQLAGNQSAGRRLFTRRNWLLGSGTDLKTDSPGTSGTGRAFLAQRTAQRLLQSVTSVASNICSTPFALSKKGPINFAPTIASQPSDAQAALMTLRENAQTAASPLSLTATQRRRLAETCVRVSSYQKLSLQEVFDISVEDAPEFFANGILVSNCQDALRYTAVHLVRRQKFNKAADTFNNNTRTVVNPLTGRRREY